eukprot:4225898-Pleurochrysis_carterae.AAC.1
MVAASSAVEGDGTLLNEVRAARNRSAVRWTLADGLRTVCGKEVSPRTRRKLERSASGRASPVWNDKMLVMLMNFRFSGTGNRLEARSGVGSEGAVDASAGTSGVVCWFRVLRRLAKGGHVEVGSGAGGEKQSVKSAEESWRAERQPLAAAQTCAWANAVRILCASSWVSNTLIFPR